MNIVEEEFKNLMAFMYDGTDIPEGQKKDMEKSFYAGAMAVNLAILKSSDSDNPEKNIGDLFEFIAKQCKSLAEEK